MCLYGTVVVRTQMQRIMQMSARRRGLDAFLVQMEARRSKTRAHKTRAHHVLLEGGLEGVLVGARAAHERLHVRQALGRHLQTRTYTCAHIHTYS